MPYRTLKPGRKLKPGKKLKEQAVTPPKKKYKGRGTKYA